MILKCLEWRAISLTKFSVAMFRIFIQKADVFQFLLQWWSSGGAVPDFATWNPASPLLLAVFGSGECYELPIPRLRFSDKLNWGCVNARFRHCSSLLANLGQVDTQRDHKHCCSQDILKKGSRNCLVMCNKGRHCKRLRSSWLLFDSLKRHFRKLCLRSTKRRSVKHPVHTWVTLIPLC